MLNKPINLARIEEEWQTTNPKNEALPRNIQDIIAQQIVNNPNTLQLIDWIKADHQEQRHKLKNWVLPWAYTPCIHTKAKTSQPCIIQAQTYINRYNALHIEETNRDDEIEETPQMTWVEKIKTPLPILNDKWDRIDEFIWQNEEYYSTRRITSSTKKVKTTLSNLDTPDIKEWSTEFKKWLKQRSNDYDIPMLWELFTQELKVKAKDIWQTQILTEIYNLKMQGFEIKQYIDKFEKLADQAGLLAINPDTTHLFMKGLTTSVQSNICKKPIYGYHMAWAYALDDVLVTWMALYLICSQNPTPPEKQDIPTPQTRKWPLAEDYMDKPPTKQARIARLTTNTNFPVESFESRWQWKATQRLAWALSPKQASPREKTSQENSPPPVDTNTIRTDTSDVYISAPNPWQSAPTSTLLPNKLKWSPYWILVPQKILWTSHMPNGSRYLSSDFQTLKRSSMSMEQKTDLDS